MEKYIILYGCAAKPELSDEVKGFFHTEDKAEKYCKNKNMIAEDGYAYWYETVPELTV